MSSSWPSLHLALRANCAQNMPLEKTNGKMINEKTRTSSLAQRKTMNARIKLSTIHQQQKKFGHTN